MVETVFFYWAKILTTHTCAIKDAKSEDAGRWRCEVESYAIGKYRGYGYNVTSEFDIKFIPKVLTSTTAATKTSQGKNYIKVFLIKSCTLCSCGPKTSKKFAATASAHFSL